MNDPLRNVLDRLDRVKRSNGYYKARCPAHDDREPSLSVKLADDGRVLIKCHAGCSVDEIVETIGMRKGDLFEGDPPHRNGKRGNPRKREWVIRDETGEPQAIHHRLDLPEEGKRVWWTAPDGTKGLGGRPISELPLYGSENTGPDVSVIVVVEGEKAADALSEHLRDQQGIAAVGTSTGASGTPGRGALESLGGKRVILWPDNDEEGRAHMRRIGDALSEIAEEVRWFEWKEAPPKGDAADCKNLAEIERSLQDAPIYVPRPTHSPSEPVSLGKYAAQGISIIEQRVSGEGITGIRTGLREVDRNLGGLNDGLSYVIAAQTFGAKSLFAGQIALVAAKEQGVKTLLVSLEQAPWIYGDRFVHAMTGIDHKTSREGRISKEEQQLLKDAWRSLDELSLVIAAGEFHTEDIWNMAENLGSELVVVDYLQAVRADDPKAPRWEQVSQISRDLTKIKTELNIPLVMTAQVNRAPQEGSKPKRPQIWHIANASDIERYADAIMVLYNPHQAKIKGAEPGVLGIFCDKYREGQPWSTEVRFKRGLPWLEDIREETPENEGTLGEF